MIEDALSFEKALDIDEKVWRIMPRIQSKKLRELYGIEGNSLQDLLAALRIKFELERYQISTGEIEEDNVKITVHGCPWFDIMKQSGRAALAGIVGERICNAEYQGWADSFDKRIKFSLVSQMCKGQEVCELRFQIRCWRD
jgi:hypothetical protein